MDEKKIIRIVSKALKKKISVKSTSSNTEEWDSLGHLSIMAAFGKETKGTLFQYRHRDKPYFIDYLYSKGLKINEIMLGD